MPIGHDVNFMKKIKIELLKNKEGK